MRCVKVTFEDGTTKQYGTIKQAANDLRVAKTAINRMSVGCSKRTMLMLHITNVQIGGNRYVKHVRPVGGKPLPIKCTNEDGTVLYARSIKEAKAITHFDHYIHFCIDSGLYHWGWRFDSMEQQPDYDDRLEFGTTPVPDDLIENVARITKWYLSRYNHMSLEEKEDITQYATSHVAAEYSRDEHLKSTYNLRVWSYFRTLHYGARKAHKWWMDYMRHVEKPEGLDMDRDEWIGELAGSLPQSDEEFLKTLPDKYQQCARLILEGRNTVERSSLLGMSSGERMALERELGEWLRHHPWG